MKYGIAVDTSKCMGCYACFTACKDEHCGFDGKYSKAQPMMGQFWVNLKEKERGDSDRKIKLQTVTTLCAHCDDPACQKASSGGAVYKRDDGIVIVDPEKSKGQKAIVDACPIGAIFWNEELEIPQKCTMCAELLDDPDYLSYLGDEKFKVPRCVEACPTRALNFGDLDDPESKVSKIIAQNRVTPLKGLEGQSGSVVHLNIPTVYLAGTVYQPAELEEVAIGVKVVLTSETGETFETETNYFGDWEVEWLPMDTKFDIKFSLDGYKELAAAAVTDDDHYIGPVYLEAI
jgi:Fe-S-cluster-containing dehydrogenase component